MCTKQVTQGTSPTMNMPKEKKKRPTGRFAFLRGFGKLFKRKKKRAAVSSEPCSPPPPPQEGPASPKPGSDLELLSCEGQRRECEATSGAEHPRPNTQHSPADNSGSGHPEVPARYEEEEKEEESWNGESPARPYFRDQGIPLLEAAQISQLTNYYQESIGCGSYGSCCRTRVPGTGQEVVVKTFCQDALEDLFTEASMLQSLQMAGVQRLVGVCVETCQMVTCFAGQIAKDFLGSPVTQYKDAVSVCLQVAQALRRLHLRGVAHNDIKGNNVCVKVSDHGPVSTIIDLGLARTIGTRGVYAPAPPHRYPWAAPELKQENALPCSEESDIYSLAHFIVHTVELRCCRQRCPALHTLCQLLQDAQQPDPSTRPTLPTVIRALEELQRHVLAPAPPPARGSTTPTPPAARHARCPQEAPIGRGVAVMGTRNTIEAPRSSEYAGTVALWRWVALVVLSFFGVHFIAVMLGLGNV